MQSCRRMTSDLYNHFIDTRSTCTEKCKFTALAGTTRAEYELEYL